jgi:GTP-binding protein EngB required for normal cell division
MATENQKPNKVVGPDATVRSQITETPRRNELKEYTGLKLEVADIVLAAMQMAREQKNQEAEAYAQRLLARIAEDRFNLVVVGLFNRGKSSLMNAVLGLDRLPVGVLPLTSVVTTVSYGSRERLLIQTEGSSLLQQRPISRLAEYVTERGNPGNQKHVTLAEVQLPADILRRGFHFIDTPGVGSALADNTAATEAFLPEADAIIFVTSFDFPLTGEELEFLRKVRRHVRKIFVVVNKMDLVSQSQRVELTDFLRSQVEKEFGFQKVRIFAVSARDGLAGKQANQPTLLAASGLAELGQSLSEFLTQEKSREFLMRVADRAQSLLFGQQTEHSLREHAARNPEFFSDRLQKLETRIGELGRLQSKSAASQLLRSAGAGDKATPKHVVRNLLPGREQCPACRVVKAVEETAVADIVARLSDVIGDEPRDVPSLCLPHLAMILDETQDGHAGVPLLLRQADILEGIAEDMQSRALKQGAARRDLLSEEERDAHLRGLALLAGHAALSMPWNEEKRI